MDEPWIMTVKGLNSNNRTSVFNLEEASYSNGSSNSDNSGHDVNLNHLKIVGLNHRPKSFSPTSSPTREVPESEINQKSVILLKEKKDEKFVIESTIDTARKNEEFMQPRKSLEKDAVRSPVHQHEVSTKTSEENNFLSLIFLFVIAAS